MAGSEIVYEGRNKREVETLNALLIHHQLVNQGLTRAENCCPCKIVSDRQFQLISLARNFGYGHW